MGRSLRLYGLAICTKTAEPTGFVVGAKAVPNFDRLIRTPFNNRDYGRHARPYLWLASRTASVLTDLGIGPFNSVTG